MSENSGPDNRGRDQADDFDLTALMADFEKQMSALRQQSQAARPLIDATSVRVESEGHEVAVTATIAGELVDVELLPAAASVSATELSAVIFSTYEQAATTARGRSHEVVAGFLDHNTAMRNLARRLLEESTARRARQQDPEPSGELDDSETP